MSWTIDPTVTINGVSYTSNSLNGVSISYGRSTIWEQPRYGYASIRIKNDNNSVLAISLNNSVIIKVDNFTGTPTTVFTGKVSSITSAVQTSGSTAKVVIHTITAVAPLADMARVITHTTNWPKEYDDDRLDRILIDSGVTIDVVDTPGVYEFTTSPASPTDCYSAASYYAQMAFGYIYETTNGKVGYANESRRKTEKDTYGYFNIPTNVILGNSIQSELNSNNLVNDILLEYKAAATVTATSASSISTYGRRAFDLLTELEDGTQAQFQADRYIFVRSTPETVIQSFTVQLNAPAITSTVLNGLIAVYMGKPIEVNAFPNGIFNGIFRGFVEGWTMTISQNTATLNLNVTDYHLSLSPTRWQEVNAALIWDNVDPTIEWSDFEQGTKLALSPNYSWPEPDNSDFVKDGATDIRALGNAIDATVYAVANYQNNIIHPFLLMGA